MSGRPPTGSVGLDVVGTLSQAVGAQLEAATREASRGRWVERIWRRDATLWSSDEGAQRTIAQRLGWLRAPAEFADMTPELGAFAASVADSYNGAVLAGMGGSSLAPALFASTFGPAPGGMPVVVLDSTDPEAVIAVDRLRPPAETLYLIATKSGTTTETLAFLAHFLAGEEAAAEPAEDVLERLQDMVHPGPEPWESDQFVAITDPGESVQRIPYSNRFREVFLNPPDVGGRYSALTYVGLVPAALLGVDLDALLASATEMAERCKAPDDATNPGLALGLLLGSAARAGRDKLTLVIDAPIAALGPWIEQLVAESTGKQGRGIVPVDGETLGGPEAYDDDRIFVAVHLADGGHPERLSALAAAGHPVITITVPKPTALGAEFFRWEFATAVAGAALGIDPFDEPNVTESKRNTERVLDERPVREGGISVQDGDLVARLRAHGAKVPARGYLALTAFIAPSVERSASLQAMRHALRDATHRATTVGYGPRYLHSTGQLHKGGPPVGWFLQLVAGHPQDLPVPGHDYSFGTLIDAQADGDLAALRAHGLPALRVDLGRDADAGLALLETAVAEAFAGR